MKNYIFSLIFFIYVPFISSHHAPDLISVFRGKVSFLNTVEGKNSFITYVMINGKKYIVKQKKKAYKKQVALLRDALAAYIAQDLNVAHEVDMVAYDKVFPGKIYAHLPALILSIAPGEEVRKQKDSMYRHLHLSQRCGERYSFQEQGLTRNIINQMSWHEQLPIIIGLDLFIGNSDRHGGNLFYNLTTDSFCAIDMDNTFNRDLCELACKKLIYMNDIGEVALFSEKEINALNSVKTTLQYLVEKFSSRRLIKKMYALADKAGFCPGTPLYDITIEKRLLLYEQMIVKTHASAYDLIALLDRIILDEK